MTWEYKVKRIRLATVKSDTDLVRLESDLNDLGEDGWEAVSWWHTMHERLSEHGVEHSLDTLVLFKRQISK